jgi:hypothetical protein
MGKKGALELKASSDIFFFSVGQSCDNGPTDEIAGVTARLMLRRRICMCPDLSCI